MCGNVLLRERHRGIGSINAAAGGSVDEAFNPDEVGMLEDFQSAETIDCKVEFWIVDRVLVGEVSGEVVYDVGSLFERPTKILVPGHVATKEVNLGTSRDVPFVGGREV